MPFIRTYVIEGTPPAQKKQIAKGIQQAMIDTFGIPDDDYFQVTHEMAEEDLIFDRNFFGVARGPRPVMISLSFNSRPAEAKQALFEAIAANLTRDAGIAIEDIYMSILEAAPANWWVHARTIDPETGTDSRMSKA